MAGTQGAHNSGEIIIWVGNNYCPKADIFRRQSLAITALVVQSFDSAITQIKIYSVDNAIWFPNYYLLNLAINFIQQIVLSNDWTTGARPLTCSNSKINHFQGFLLDPILDWETELIWTLFTTGLFHDFTLMLLPYSVFVRDWRLILYLVSYASNVHISRGKQRTPTLPCQIYMGTTNTTISGPWKLSRRG